MNAHAGTHRTPSESCAIDFKTGGCSSSIRIDEDDSVLIL